jgi:hypothetical protein
VCIGSNGYVGFRSCVDVWVTLRINHVRMMLYWFDQTKDIHRTLQVW